MFDMIWTDKFISDYLMSHSYEKSKFYVNVEYPNHGLKYVKHKLVIPIKFCHNSYRQILDRFSDIKNIFFHGFQINLHSIIDLIPEEINVYWIFFGMELYQMPLLQTIFDEITERNYLEIRKNGGKISQYIPTKIYKQFLLVREKIVYKKMEQVLSRINYFCHWNILDFKYTKNMFPNFRAEYLHFWHGTNDLENYDITSILQTKFHDHKNYKNKKIIMIGHSASISLNHLSILKYLKELRNDKFVVACPLSYGSKNNKKIIQKYLRENYEGGYITLENIISLKDYRTFLSNIDILVMNNIRTQGAGNIADALRLGKKVYLHPKNTFYRMLKQMGITIYTVEDLYNSSIEEIITPLKQSAINKNFNAINGLYLQDDGIRALP